MTLTLTGYGGVGEIGGNAFLLDDGKTRLFLDFGKQFGNDPTDEKGTSHRRAGYGDYFDFLMRPRSCKMVSDLMALDLLPQRPQDYRPDVGGAPGPASIDAVVLSHAHIDHAGMIPYLKPEIPILATDATRITLAHMEDVGSGVESQFIQTKPSGMFHKTARDEIGYGHGPEGPARDWRTQAQHTVADWRIQMLAVDHSIQGAAGALLDNGETRIAYTGDFRMHGRAPEATHAFLKAVEGLEPDFLICEGTNVGAEHKHHDNDNEQDVEEQIRTAIGEFEKAGGKFVCVAYPPKDLDRLVSLHSVAQEMGRVLVITISQTAMIDELRKSGMADLPDPLTDPNLAVLLPIKGRGAIRFRKTGELPVSTQGKLEPDWKMRAATDFLEDVRRDYEAAGRKGVVARALDQGEGTWVDAEHIRDDPSAYILTVSYFSIQVLIDIFPDPSQASGLYVHSQTQPFNDEMIIQRRKLDRWLKRFNLDYVATHVSGHVSPDELERILDDIGARTIVPIHSMAPDMTGERYESRTGNSAILLDHGMERTIA